MNSHYFALTPRVVLATFAVGVLSMAPAFAQMPWGQRAAAANPTAGLQVATSETEATSLAGLAGTPLHSINGEELGFIGDFLLDPATGQMRFAVVPSGSGAEGETFRFVPMAVMEPQPSADGSWRARIGRREWDRTGTVAVARFTPRMTFSVEDLQRAASQYGLRQPIANGPIEVVRAFSMRGLEVRSDNQVMGTIQDVAFDIPRQAASAIFQPNRRFARTPQKLLLSFDRLQIPGDVQVAVTTNLPRADLQQVAPPLSPTGYTNAPFASNNQRGDAALAIQRALGNSGVQAISESRIVLRGTVESQQRKQQIEQAAQQAAPGVRIDSELTVRGW